MCWRSGHDARTGSRSCAGARAATTGCVLDARPRHRGRMGRARRAAGAPARPGRAIAEAEPRADRGACRCRRVVGRRDRVRRGVALREPTRRSSRAVHRPHPTARDRTAHPRTVRRSPAGSSAEPPATRQRPTPCRPVGRPLRGRHDDRGGSHQGASKPGDDPNDRDQGTGNDGQHNDHGGGNNGAEGTKKPHESGGSSSSPMVARTTDPVLRDFSRSRVYLARFPRWEG